MKRISSKNKTPRDVLTDSKANTEKISTNGHGKLAPGIYTIQLSPKNVDEGFGVLISFGQVGMRRNHTYTVSRDHLEALDKKGVKYRIVSE